MRWNDEYSNFIYLNYRGSFNWWWFSLHLFLLSAVQIIIWNSYVRDFNTRPKRPPWSRGFSFVSAWEKMSRKSAKTSREAASWLVFAALRLALSLSRRKISGKTLGTMVKTAGFLLECPFIFARGCSFKRAFLGKIWNIPPYRSNTRFYSLVSDAWIFSLLGF